MNVNGVNPYYNQMPYKGFQQPQNSITWVQGLEGAKAYQIMPNSNVVLMDSESDIFYIKSSDNIGMCTLRIFNYQEQVEKPKSEYVTKEEFQQFIAQLSEQKGEADEPVPRTKPATNTKHN